MRIRSFEEMLAEYEASELEKDKVRRQEMLSRHSYTIIVEGGFMEVENLDKWLEINFGKDNIYSLFYGKTGYDYGCWEYFFDDEEQALKTAKAVVNIYTYYPAAPKPNFICKSVGYDEDVEYNPEDPEAINDFSIKEKDEAEKKRNQRLWE